MTDYGLPGHRDSEGNLKPTDHTFDWNGQDVTIRILPPTLSQIDEIENLPEDVSADVMEEHLTDIVVKPEVEDMTVPEMNAFIQGVMDYAYSGGTALAQEARAELDEREAEAAGN